MTLESYISYGKMKARSNDYRTYFYRIINECDMQ